MRCLLDADILAYEFGNMKQLEEPEKPLEWEITRSLVDDRIKQIVEYTKAESLSCYLTDSKSNFRNRVATILPYKAGRKQEKPYHWENIRQHLIDQYDAEVQYGIEADDRLGIEQMTDTSYKTALYDNTVICSRDKDLDMIPGFHYVWECGKQKEKYWFQDDLIAIRSFYKQLLTGDRSTDNILGLYGVGASSSLVRAIDQMGSEQVMFNHVFNKYIDRFGGYACKFMWENASLLWILREEPNDLPEIEIEDRLNDLESEYNNE